jgi:hypothetical protein
MVIKLNGWDTLGLVFPESTMAKPLKRWSVNAISTGQAPLALFCDDRPLGRLASQAPDNLTPIQSLLISIASCFALSCRAELRRRNRSPPGRNLCAR